MGNNSTDNFFKHLLRRLSTAVIFVVVMLGGIYGGRYTFVALFALITALCLWEYLSMVLERYSRRDSIRMLLGLGFGLTPFFLATILQLDLLPTIDDGTIIDTNSFIVFTAILFFPFVFMAFIYELFSQSKTPFMNVAFIVLGMVYIGAPFALLDFIAFDGKMFYADTVFGILLMTWANDTGAYLVGSQIGKTPLAPTISPKKTWEGSIGGVVITLLISAILAYIFAGKENLQFVDWLVLGGIVVVFGSVGDLVESMLKRSVKIKDSGSLLPGHGGLLDRFDAFIFLLPFAAAYLLWVR